jgi:hypothetical protein
MEELSTLTHVFFKGLPLPEYCRQCSGNCLEYMTCAWPIDQMKTWKTACLAFTLIYDILDDDWVRDDDWWPVLIFQVCIAGTDQGIATNLLQT